MSKQCLTKNCCKTVTLIIQDIVKAQRWLQCSNAKNVCNNCVARCSNHLAAVHPVRDYKPLKITPKRCTLYSRKLLKGKKKTFCHRLASSEDTSFFYEKEDMSSKRKTNDMATLHCATQTVALASVTFTDGASAYSTSGFIRAAWSVKELKSTFIDSFLWWRFFIA